MYLSINFSNAKNFLASQYAMEGANLLIMALHFLLVGFLVKTFAKLLSNSAHLFFAEMQFESLLVYFKCEGTFTESKISTGRKIRLRRVNTSFDRAIFWVVEHDRKLLEIPGTTF